MTTRQYLTRRWNRSFLALIVMASVIGILEQGVLRESTTEWVYRAALFFLLAGRDIYISFDTAECTAPGGGVITRPLIEAVERNRMSKDAGADPTVSDELTPGTQLRIALLFSPANREYVSASMREECGSHLPFLDSADRLGLERVRFAVLKLSGGDLVELQRALDLAKQDWRDVLASCGFGDDIHAHSSWWPPVPLVPPTA